MRSVLLLSLGNGFLVDLFPQRERTESSRSRGFRCAYRAKLVVDKSSAWDFLDGRVIVFRGSSGTAQVSSAYCPHLGADLSVGDVQGDTVRCAFHHWQYDRNGVCVKTGIGDPPPPGACLFTFPTAEKHGLIWAFNGEEPLFAIPDFPYSR